MSYTIKQLLTLKTKSIFENMPKDQLLEIEEMLKDERKSRMTQFVKPLMDEHVKPITDSIIKPVKKEHIAPISKVLKDLKTYLPKQKAKPAYISIGGKRYGPMTKKAIIDMITEVEEEKND